MSVALANACKLGNLLLSRWLIGTSVSVLSPCDRNCRLILTALNFVLSCTLCNYCWYTYFDITVHDNQFSMLGSERGGSSRDLLDLFLYLLRRRDGVSKKGGIC